MKIFNAKVKRVQKHIESLDMLKMPRSNSSVEKKHLEERQNTTVEKIVKKQQPLKQSDSVVVTTKWETFD